MECIIQRGGYVGSAIAVDSNSNVYLSGNSYRNDGTHSVAIKFDSNGLLLWERVSPFITAGGDTDIGVDSNGNVYAAGSIYDSSGNQKFFAIKYSSSGNLSWNITYDSGVMDVFGDMAVDMGGNVYIISMYMNTISPSYIFDTQTTKIDSAGNILWNKIHDWGGIDQAAVVAGGIATDKIGNVYVTAAGVGCGYYCFHSYILKYDSSGNLIWKVEGGWWNDDIALDSLGNIYIAGTTPNPNPFLMKYKSSAPMAMQVLIDIKPGSFPNSIKLQDTGNIPVAIFSTPMFDAASIDVATLELNSAGVRIVKGKGLQYSFEDINGDGLLDLMIHFDRGTLQLTARDTSATVIGMTMDGKQIHGTDSVQVIE